MTSTRSTPPAQPLLPGQRVSLRRQNPSGALRELIGLVVASGPAVLALRDRSGAEHQLRWSEVVALRTVGVPLGRNPLRTSRAELDLLAAAAGVDGRVFVGRLSELLAGHQPPPPLPWLSPPPSPAVLEGEWVTCGGTVDLLPLAWWASHHDARSIQVRTVVPGVIAELNRCGLVEV